ncbi:MAG: NUDIX domain-containing protein [Candidatus Hydrogenedentes bacterium]|nr:NUDIX domain-containing protein [Candidatus Hydrogenedentota bacterium]
MYSGPEPFQWNYCPICGGKLETRDDGQGDRPHCVPCRRFYYSNPIPAACCFVRQGDGLLFVQRAVEPCKGLWTLPGGFVELGETTEEAALRELEEETGLTGRGLRLIGASTQQSRYSGAVTVLGYLVEGWQGEPVPKTDAMALDFFDHQSRPPLAFQAHRELLATFDALMGRAGIT